ncbi:RNA polymerase sigma factor [Cohnella faecalis]|uniref:RNA polymerase sigma factor n=1 Tax=Cohnella faecalis TaxID=2315694 RepID=A0A398CV42_9BACL|nr:sigma-70 family RNA polymerase sigma factor [Cohnella faecalis]RIE03757.1 sigma-70 family RNA polymerase sigma factor [Cohnella faecalis]
MQTNLLLLLGSNFYELNAALQEQLYKQFYNFLYRPVMQLIHDHSATEDIIQETFLTTLRKPPKDVLDEPRFKAWIKIVAKNNVINHLRKTKNYRTDISLESVISMGIPFAAASESVELQAELNSLKEQISLHLKEMRPDHRAVLEMKWKKGLSYKEIADELHETEDTIRQKLFRARMSLKNKLQQEWGKMK